MEYTDLIRIRESVRNYDPNQIIFGIAAMGYPKPGFKKSSIKKRKSLSEIVEFL